MQDFMLWATTIAWGRTLCHLTLKSADIRNYEVNVNVNVIVFDIAPSRTVLQRCCHVICIQQDAHSLDTGAQRIVFRAHLKQSITRPTPNPTTAPPRHNAAASANSWSIVLYIRTCFWVPWPVDVVCLIPSQRDSFRNQSINKIQRL